MSKRKMSELGPGAKFRDRAYMMRRDVEWMVVDYRRDTSMMAVDEFGAVRFYKPEEMVECTQGTPLGIQTCEKCNWNFHRPSRDICDDCFEEMVSKPHTSTL